MYHWEQAIAPSGMAFYADDRFPAWQGSLFIGGFESTTLVWLPIAGEKVTGEERLLRDIGERIRDVVQGPDGALCLLTDSPRERALKLVPKK